MDTYGIDLMGRRRRRRHTPDFKASVIAQCMRPGVSVAAVALAHSLNANMLRKWVIDAQHNPSSLPPAVSPQEPPPQPAPTFIPLALTAPAIEGDIRIEHQRSGTTVTVVWPASAAAACAAWLRDWLR